MGKVKCNKGGITSFIGYVDQIKGLIDTFFSSNVTSVETLNKKALDDLNTKLAATDATKTDSEGNTTDNPEYGKIKAKIEIANNNATKISNAKSKQSEIDKILENVSNISRANNIL